MSCRQGSIPCTYQLHIELARPLRLAIGWLGVFDIPAGHYVYTGSARRNLEARIAHHQSKIKKLHWHIDYLLASPHARITAVHTSSEPECQLNQHTQGAIPIPGFGASDCRAGCGSHLKLLS
jgi:Uri superfamily endonuclease